jgi:hypothetical protein
VAFTSDTIRRHAAGLLIDAKSTDKWEQAKKTFDDVMKWINLGSAVVTVLTFLASKYGIVGIVCAIKFNSDHMMNDNCITMFAQREDGSVKRSAEITGGYNTALVNENLMYLEK